MAGSERQKPRSSAWCATTCRATASSAATRSFPPCFPSIRHSGDEVDADLLAETVVKNNRHAAQRRRPFSAELTGGNLVVRVTNETATSCRPADPEGRRMWLHVRAYDAQRQVIFESGRYVFETATLEDDPSLHVWEDGHGNERRRGARGGVSRRDRAFICR
jgi:hypothetical protein